LLAPRVIAASSLKQIDSRLEEAGSVTATARCGLI